MNIRRITTILFLSVVTYTNSKSQTAAPSSGAAMAAGRNEAVPVNNFTGIPAISIPLYSYSHRSGIGINVSLDYFAGGIKVNEAPGAAGLGWNIDAGGVITRTVRAVPDDCPNKGYFYVPVIPADIRANELDYKNECTDGEQDIFQFNFGGRSGKFYIGKDSQCLITPLSKMRISVDKRPYESDGPIYDSLIGTIEKFTITTETGEKYIFNDVEFQTTYVINCIGGNKTYTYLKYGTAWYLSKIIASSGKDSIKFSYTTTSNTAAINWSQNVKMIGGTFSHSDTSWFNATGRYGTAINNKVPSIIELPDSKKIVFLYGGIGQYGYKYYPVLQRIKIMDSTFRYGYLMNWDTIGMGENAKDFLKGINYYTNTAKKQGYEFTYNSPYFSIPKEKLDRDSSSYYYPLNKKDHWGFYNGANNNNEFVPSVPGLYNGANREPNALAIASSLASVKDPAGGTTYYQYENNDLYPYTSSSQSINTDASLNTQSTISINNILGNTTYFKISFDPSFTRSSTSTVSQQAQLVINFTDATGNIVYGTNTVNLNELYNTGIVRFSAALPNGSYLLKTSLAVGTTSSTSLPVIISWYKQASTSGNTILTSGIRIKQIRHFDPFSNKTDTLVTYKYITENGLSSGFLGLKPVYNYYSNGILFIQSNAVGDLDYGQGNRVGYKRVEVIKGSVERNLGKQVFEYTGLDEQGSDISPIEYPYIPRFQRDWAFGLPKRILTYDNTGRLVQATKNTFNFTMASQYGNANNASVKVISSSYYIAEKYYPESGRADLISSADTFFHPDNSITVNSKSIVYDTNYNPIKIITPFDYNRSLNAEKRIYYPYNYTIPGGILGYMRDNSIFAPISTETWITGDANPRLLSATVNYYSTFSLKYLKPLASYGMESNIPLPLSVAGAFDPSTLIRSGTKINPQLNYIYGGNYFLLQTNNAKSGINNSIIYGNAAMPIASVTNAAYTDIAYTSFEPNSPGTWEIASSVRDSTSSITGKFAYDLSLGQIKRNSLNASVTYMLSYWTKGNSNVSFNDSFNPILTEQRNGWNFYTLKFTGITGVTLSGYGGTLLIDELRLYPADANMTTTTYNKNDDVANTCDANNNIIYYEYDLVNRVKLLRDKDKNIIKKYDYADIITPFNTAPDWQVQDSVFTWICEKDSISQNNGKVDRKEKDMNPASDSYLTERFVYDHTDYNRCPLPAVSCGTDIRIKRINGTCQTADKICTSSVRSKRTLSNGSTVFYWVCTYQYQWSDGSIYSTYAYSLPNINGGEYVDANLNYHFTEEHSTACPIGGF